MNSFRKALKTCDFLQQERPLDVRWLLKESLSSLKQPTDCAKYMAQYIGLNRNKNIAKIIFNEEQRFGDKTRIFNCRYNKILDFTYGFQVSMIMIRASQHFTVRNTSEIVK